jgi:hypothetical protein
MKRIAFLLIFIVSAPAVFAQHSNNKKHKATAPATQHLKLYPTTADKYVNIYVEFEAPTDIIITLLPTDRNNEKSWTIKAITSHQQSLDVTALPDGQYTIQLSAGKIMEKAEFNIKR